MKEEKISARKPGGRAGGPMGGANISEKPKNFKKAFKGLMGELKNVKWSLIVSVVLAVVSAIITVYLPQVMKKIYTELPKFFVPGFVPNDVFTGILNIIITLGCFYVGTMIITAISNRIIATASQKICYSLREKMRKKLSAVELKYYDTHKSGDILSRIITDTDTISSNLQTVLSNTIVSIFVILTTLIFMFTMSWSMTLISIAILPITLILGMSIIKGGQKHFVEQARGVGNITSICEENYSALRVIQAYNMQGKVSEDFAVVNNKLVGSNHKSVVFSGLSFPIINFVNNFSYVFLATVGCIFALKNMFTVDALLIFLQYTNSLNMQLTQVTQISQQLQSTVAAFERIEDVLETEESSDVILDKLPEKIIGNIRFENVKFGYSNDKILMKDVSFEVKPGELTAIVGKTGAGKTTLVNLLMRFYDIQGGKILLDGTDIKELPKSFVRKNIGMVLQDVWLFNGTIAENIAFGKEDATREEIIAAAKKAECHHFINTLPNGYDTVISEEGGNISVGQKQLLTIARAILTNPQVMILDEATSSVDTKTETKIQIAMGQALENRTSFVIAHRLSTIKKADKILVMEGGDIIESGSHDELIKKGGAYCKLYNSQN